MSTQWFAAHVILYAKLTGAASKSIPVWENVILIQAESEEEAFAKAERYGQRQAGDGTRPAFTWGGQPARWIFGGVRKLTLCDNPEERPDDGTEITYLQMRVASDEALEKLLAGEDVGVTYIEQFHDTLAEEPA